MPNSGQTESQALTESVQPHTNGDNVMSDDLVTPENISKELLRSIFDAAFMETSFDKDGDLIVKDQVRCYVYLSEKKDRITLICGFGFKKGIAEVQRLNCVNNINTSYIMVRAASKGNDTLTFDYNIYVPGGISKKNIVLATKRFMLIPREAVADHGRDIVE
jgi:hypothetical protein